MRLSDSETAPSVEDFSDVQSEDGYDSKVESERARLAEQVTSWLDRHFDSEEEEEGHRVDPKIEAVVRKMTLKAQQIIWNINHLPQHSDDEEEEGEEAKDDKSVGFCTQDVFEILSDLRINRCCKFSWGLNRHCKTSRKGEEGQVIVWGE